MNKELIYHYTDINALQSILSNNTLWMTSHQFLNDTEEFKDGYNRLEKSINECMIKYEKTLSPATKESIQELLVLLDNTLVLSTSFSKNSDLLSQWRSYCPIEGGFSIGFEKEAIGKLENHNEFSPRIYECVYDENEKQRLAKTFGEDLILGHSSMNNFDKDKRSSFKSTLYYWLMFVIQSKNINFKEEQEVRLATFMHKEFDEIDIFKMPHHNASTVSYCDSFKVYKNKKLSFRTKSNILIPYYEKDFDINSIKEITIGPSANQLLSKESLEFFIKSLNLNIEIKNSKIPFRSL